ncbi:uncharacterized protein [Nicotiana tomentosiformis]|uniref:uncharacterized protein n=1 Tax=Nicotiana tomentosiformis TaxID=4098 RepID=UPI00388C35BE
MQKLTKEQYNQLLSILKNFHAGNGGNDLKAEVVNFAGISSCSTSFNYGSNPYECFRSNVNSWILDSMTSNHMTYNKSMLNHVKTLVYPFLVTLPNGYKVKVTLIGDVVMNPRFTLKRVLFVPSFKFNLIYVHCLKVQLDCLVIFTKFSCIFLHAPSQKRTLAIGKRKDGLYLYSSDSCKSNSLIHATSSSSSNKSDTITHSFSHVPPSPPSKNNVVSHSVSHVVSSSHTM